MKNCVKTKKNRSINTSFATLEIINYQDPKFDRGISSHLKFRTSILCRWPNLVVNISVCGFITYFWGCAFMYNVVLSLIFCPRKIGENAFLCCFKKLVGATGQRIEEIGSNFFYEIKPYVSKTVCKYRIVSKTGREEV